MAQLELFNDEKNEEYLAADFIETIEMRAVLDVLEKFLSNNDFDAKEIPNIIIKGTKFSGKTHLVSYLKAKFDVEIVNLAKFDFENGFVEGSFYVFEDVDEIGDDEKILNIINLAKEARSFLIFTLKDDIKTKIKDLRSRLRNFFIVCEILGPCEETLRQLIMSNNSRTQRKISRSEINKLVSISLGNYEKYLILSSDSNRLKEGL